jgi:hypothetical protein
MTKKGPGGFEGFVKKQFELQQKLLTNLSERMRDLHYGQSVQEKRLDEIEQNLRGVLRAIDSDSVQIVDHERRIARLEVKK